MSHFLNYYPCDTLPISRLNIKLSKNSFVGDNREMKIKKMIHSMGFSPCNCSKSVAWCLCRDMDESNKLRNILEQIEQQIGESGLEYKLYLNELVNDKGKKISSFDKRTASIPDLIHQETQYEPMDYKAFQTAALKAQRLSTTKPKIKRNNSKTSVRTPTGSNQMPL